MTKADQPMAQETRLDTPGDALGGAQPAGRESGVQQPSLFEEIPDVAIDPGEPGIDTAVLDRVFAFEGDPPRVYLASVLIGSFLVLAAATLGLFPWLASALGVVGLLATMFRGGRWVALGCGLAIVVVAVVTIWPRESTLADVGLSGSTSRGQSVAEEPPEGSLGFRLSELAGLWNAIEEPPTVNRGFSRSLERGPLDGFVLRFDEGASLAGAYDPSDDYVYALWASFRLDHEAASTMYLHLCFILHPYSQECIDAYWEALDANAPSEHLGSRHSAEWQLGEETWRLAIVGNVQEIRVLGDPPG